MEKGAMRFDGRPTPETVDSLADRWGDGRDVPPGKCARFSELFLGVRRKIGIVQP
jgi:hypothetical protein